jgi:hypothetical protein
MSLHLEINQGLRVDDLPSLQDKVRLHGGRLVAYAEVISAALFSARSYKVKWVSPQDGPERAGLTSSIITALLGWWAIAGPYWTLSALIWNKRGGFDVTDALMRAHPGNQSFLGYADAMALGAFQQSANRLSARICIGTTLVVLGVIACLVWRASTQ